MNMKRMDKNTSALDLQYKGKRCTWWPRTWCFRHWKGYDDDDDDDDNNNKNNNGDQMKTRD